jgi:hypothetical protein
MEKSVKLIYPSRQNKAVTKLVADAITQLDVDGVLTVQDVIVPGSRLRGKKADLQRRAGEYVNTLFGMVGEEYGRCLSIYQWQKKFQKHELTIVEQETIQKWVDFDTWIAPANLGENDRIRVRALLIQAPAQALEFLTPQITGDKIQFRITETIISVKREIKN